MAALTHACRMLRSWSVRISLLAVLLLVLGPLLAMVGLVPGLQAMMLFAGAALVGLAGIVAGIISAVRGKVAPGMVAVALGTLALVAVLAPGFAGGGKPPINDISTDLQDVPVFTHARTLPENAGRNLEYPEDFKPVVRQYYPDLKSQKLAEPPDAVFAAGGGAGAGATGVDGDAGGHAGAHPGGVRRDAHLPLPGRLRGEGEAGGGGRLAGGHALEVAGGAG